MDTPTKLLKSAGKGLNDSLLEGLTDGIIVFDSARRLKAFNSSLVRLFRLPQGTLALGDSLETVLRKLAPYGGLSVELSSEASIQRRLSLWGTEADRRERRFLPDGRVFDILRSRTEEGDIMAVHVDVTESLRRERELELQRIYMESILENITDGVVLINRHGHYIAFNRRFLELYRIDPDKAYWGMHIDELYTLFGDIDGFPEEDRQGEIESRRMFALTPEVTCIDRRLGDGRTLKVSKALLPSGGCVLSIRDVTEEIRRTEELQAAHSETQIASLHKSQFLARMSHEMRTPLNGVLGVAALLRLTNLDPRQRELVEVISSSGDMLLRLIGDVLDLSRIEAGTIDLIEQPFSLCNVLHESIGLLEPLAAAKGLALVKVPSPAKPPLLVGDDVRLKQIVLNLVGNAIKFTERGGVTVSLDASVKDAGGSEADPAVCAIRIVVRDTGIGIPQTERAAIFRQFYQIDGSTTRHSGGAGLGLKITQKLVHAMAGTIDFTSVPGEGSEFRITLSMPLAPVGAAG
jgi:hypothetical protein